MNRRLHLSKTKHSKFNESGQLAAFYLFSFIWGCSILTAVGGSALTQTHRLNGLRWHQASSYAVSLFL